MKRRNKWICALKTSLAELKIYGPKGDPGAEAGPTMFTQIPWEEVRAKKEQEQEKKKTPPHPSVEPAIPKTDFNLMDRHAAVGELMNLIK